MLGKSCSNYHGITSKMPSDRSFIWCCHIYQLVWVPTHVNPNPEQIDNDHMWTLNLILEDMPKIFRRDVSYQIGLLVKTDPAKPQRLIWCQILNTDTFIQRVLNQKHVAYHRRVWSLKVDYIICRHELIT